MKLLTIVTYSGIPPKISISSMISMDGGVEGICIYPLETIELILPVLVDEYLFCISSQDAFQGGVTGGKGAGN
jgi:hypothetical protein